MSGEKCVAAPSFHFLYKNFAAALYLTVIYAGGDCLAIRLSSMILDALLPYSRTTEVNIQYCLPAALFHSGAVH
jgi:hypothetical protein